MSRATTTVPVLLAAAALLAGCGDMQEPGGEKTTPLAHDAAAGARLTVATAGDFGLAAPGAATLAAMARANPDLYLLLGDLSYAGPNSETDFCDLVRSKVGEQAPVEIVSGNHEEDTGEDGFIGEYEDCLADRLDAVGEYGRQYYFDVGKLVRFILISPDLTIDGRHYYYGPDDDDADNANLEWLEEAIDGARDAGIEWIVVGMHKNCISIGAYYCDVYQDLFSRLIEDDVDLVLAGHDHGYQRSKQISAPAGGCPAATVDNFDPDCVADDDDAYRKGAGPAFVISAAGGAPLYALHPDDPEAGYFVATMGKNTPGNRHGFTLLTISPQSLAVRFAPSEPGSFADRFEIVNPK